MNDVKSIFQKYLKDTQLLQLEQLGSEQKAVKVTEKEGNLLKDNLTAQMKFNNNIVVISIVLLCIIFLTGIFFVFYYRNSPSTIGVVFGGTFLSLLAIVTRLRKIWLEKSLMDVSLSVINDLPPEDAAKFIQTIYYNMLEDKKKEG